eukprot:UN32662
MHFQDVAEKYEENIRVLQNTLNEHQQTQMEQEKLKIELEKQLDMNDELQAENMELNKKLLYVQDVHSGSSEQNGKLEIQRLHALLKGARRNLDESNDELKLSQQLIDEKNNDIIQLRKRLREEQEEKATI